MTMTPKEAYEKRKLERNARREHLADHEQRELDVQDMLDRFVTAVERIAHAYATKTLGPGS
jgi:hypothetical protein